MVLSPIPPSMAQVETSVASEPTVHQDSTNDFDPFANEVYEEYEIADPLEPLNRGMFWFNDKLYFYAIKPVAKAYRVVPQPARESVDNFFSNLATPVRLTSALLQGKIVDALNEFGRFMMNSTFGILGLFDPAKNWAGVSKKEEDFGQTLGHYGVGHGFYLVLPVVGSSSLRDTVGLVADAQLDLSSNILDDEPLEKSIAAQGVKIINSISLDKDSYEAIKETALDPYLFVRDAYLQNRAGKVKN